MKYLILLLFFFSACAMKQEHSGTVNFQITVDQIAMTAYFEPVCRKELPEASEEAINECVKLKIGQFLDAISQIAGAPSEPPAE